MSDPIYDSSLETLAGEAVTLAPYRGDVLLIVNTASKCGLTSQYKGLQALHEQFAERGLRVLGFPCNQFAGQEPGEAEEIATFCQRNYGVSFPMHAKVEVNGAGAHPLFRHLKAEQKGILGTEAIKWNFTKFLVDREGRVTKRFAPKTEPSKLSAEIEALLGPAS